MIRRILKKMSGLYRRTSIQPYEKFRDLQPEVETLNFKHLKEIEEKLRPAYEQYVREVSSPEMAASLELATMLFVLCQTNGYRRVADLGSGFSSYTFRKYASETPGVEVYSIDDDENWLVKTKQFLSSHQLDTAHVMTLKQFSSSGLRDFDCILHDLNFVEERIKHVEGLLNLVKPGGLIIFDDVHKPHYLTDLLEILSRHKGSIYTLRPVTEDRFGRYSLAYLCPK